MSECNHFFVLGDYKPIPSALGSRYCHCKICGMNYHEAVIKLINKSHIHAWEWLKKHKMYRCCYEKCGDWHH